jgi:hypothetical protein
LLSGAVARAGVGAFFEVKDSKRAYVAQAIHVNGKFTEEINQAITALWKTKPADKWSENHAKNFLEEDDDFHLI